MKKIKNKNKFSKIMKTSGVILGTITVMTMVYFAEQTSNWFKASVLEAPQSFDGTVMPVEKVPNWTKVGGKTTLKYNEISASDLIPIPKYDLTKLQFPDDQLIWGNSTHNDIRNAKITYSVVYMGNYKFDHQEYTGGHPAIDIKMPQGTPVKAIANGKVIKTSTQTSGFGHHVVIKHIVAPDPNNPSNTTTLYSSYSHMDLVNTQEGDNVIKGQQIGTSGNTGTSSTPHLHFQIDTADVPWSPYWPFDWQDSQNAGLSFNESVNTGLGKENGIKYTVNPMQFIYKNLNFTGGSTAQPDPKSATNTTPTTTTTQTPPVTTPVTPPVTPPAPTTTPTPKVDTPKFTAGSSSKLFSYTIAGERVSLLNNGVSLTITDESDQIKNLTNDETIDVEINGTCNVIKNKFKKTDFSDGKITIIAKSSKTGTCNITIGKSSHQISFIDKINNTAKLTIDHDGYFQKNIVEKIKIIAVDVDGNITPAVNFMGTVNISTDNSESKLNPTSIRSGDFTNGVAEINLTVENKESVIIRAKNGALVGESQPIYIEDEKIFSDIQKSHKNYEAIKYLKNKNIISGYSDGSFKPSSTVNRAEALKMLMLAFNVDVGKNIKQTFVDVDKNAWYVTTLSTAVSRGIVDGYNDGTFKPSQTVNRAEYLKILFNTNNIKPSTNIAKPYDDVALTDWFAGYAFLTNKMNILDDNSNLYPANGMTRADVAETIYRMKMIQENNLVTYSN